MAQQELVPYLDLEAAELRLAQIETPAEVRELQAEAEAVAKYLDKVGGAEARRVHVFVMRTGKRLGELLEPLRPGHGGRPPRNSPESGELDTGNLPQQRISDYIRLAQLPEERFETYIQTTPKPTVWGALRFAAEPPESTTRDLEAERQYLRGVGQLLNHAADAIQAEGVLQTSVDRADRVALWLMNNVTHLFPDIRQNVEKLREAALSPPLPPEVPLEVPPTPPSLSSPTPPISPPINAPPEFFRTLLSIKVRTGQREVAVKDEDLGRCLKANERHGVTDEQAVLLAEKVEASWPGKNKNVVATYCKWAGMGLGKENGGTTSVGRQPGPTQRPTVASYVRTNVPDGVDPFAEP